MNISNDKKSELYRAIYQPIMSLRIHIEAVEPSLRQVDEKLFFMETEIWKEVCKVLRIDKP